MQVLHVIKKNNGLIIFGTIACIAAVALGSVAGVAVAGSETGAPSGPPVPQSDTRPESVVSVLRTDTLKKSVEVPDYLILEQHGVDGILPNSLRELGSRANEEYLLGTDNAGNICLVTVLSSVEVASSVCSTPDKTEEFGIEAGAFGVAKGKDRQDVRMIFLPDSAALATKRSSTGVSRSSVDTDVWTEVAPNLIVADTEDVPEGHVEKLKVNGPETKTLNFEF